METPTLEVLRRRSGKSLGEILAEITSIAPEIAPKNRSGIVHWEQQGITDVRVIRVLEAVYSVHFDEVESAALASRKRFLETRRQRNNPVPFIGKPS